MAPLDPTVLINRLPRLLPESTKKFDSAQDFLAALLHTMMVERKFRLTAVNESLPESPTLGNIPPEGSAQNGPPPENPSPDNVLPEGWAQKGPNFYELHYEYNQRNSGFLLTVCGHGGYPITYTIKARRFLHIPRGRFLIGTI